MNTHTTITCTCPLCADQHHPDDMARDEATIALHGAPICGFCADEHTACECCGRPARFDDMDSRHGWHCKSCADTDDGAHSYTFQYRQAKASGHFA